MEKVKKKKKLGSYPYASVVFSITLALFVMGIFGLLILFSNKLSENIRGNVQMQAYLEKSVPEAERIKIQKIISAEPFVYNQDDHSGIVFISKEKAAEEFIKETGEDFTAFLGDNPLRDAFNITIAPEYQQADSLRVIREKLTKVNGIYEVTYVEDLINSINKNITSISIFLLVFAGVLVLTIVIIINNIIKLALFSQRFLIRSMQLVGAKTSFIVNPFLRRSFLHGFLSGILASMITAGLLYYFIMRIEDVKALINVEQLAVLFALLTVLGILLAVLSTYRAVNKYLKMSLDELY